MATKAQLIEFILETFEEPEGNTVSKSKLESFKKADLEEFIELKGAKEKLAKWLSER